MDSITKMRCGGRCVTITNAGKHDRNGKLMARTTEKPCHEIVPIVRAIREVGEEFSDDVLHRSTFVVDDRDES